jgi:capsid protein
MRGNRGVVFGGWRPALRDASDDVGASWDLAAARTIDLIQNSCWIAGALDQAVANTVGTGLRLKAMPENDVFGMSNDQAERWAQVVEQRWGLWADRAYECDIEGRRSFGLMQAAAFRSWFATGEIWAELPWRERAGSRYRTKVRLLPPHRVPRRDDGLRRIVHGVRMDADGMPVGYPPSGAGEHLHDRFRHRQELPRHQGNRRAARQPEDHGDVCLGRAT